jgi:hypothetical protein
MDALHYESGSVTLQSVEALTLALAERLELLKLRDILQTENTRLVLENRRLKTGDIGEAYNAGEEKIVGLLGQANTRLAETKDKLDQWEVLRKWLIADTMSASEETEREALQTATPEALVTAIISMVTRIGQDLTLASDVGVALNDDNKALRADLAKALEAVATWKDESLRLRAEVTRLGGKG